MCDDCCYCIGDVEKLEEKIDNMNVKLDELIDDVKDLKELSRSIDKGTNKRLKKIMEDYVDDVLDFRLSDFRRDIRRLSDDIDTLQSRVSDEKKQMVL